MARHQRHIRSILRNPCENYGIFHGTCEGFCSWADFAEEIFRLAAKATTVKRVTTYQDSSHFYIISYGHREYFQLPAPYRPSTYRRR